MVVCIEDYAIISFAIRQVNIFIRIILHTRLLHSLHLPWLAVLLPMGLWLLFCFLHKVVVVVVGIPTPLKKAF